MAGLLPAPAAAAQALVSLLPFDLEGDGYVTDSSADKVYRLVDLNLDGDANDLGEAVRDYEPAMGAVEGDTILVDAFVVIDPLTEATVGDTASIYFSTGLTTPLLIGLAVHFQAFVGKPDRFELSNISSLTIQ